MTIEIYLAYVLACLVITIIPGPTVTLIVANSLTHGTRAGLLNVAGTQLGLAVCIGTVAIGLASVIQSIGWWFDWLRIAGAAYLIWIGWKMFSSSGHLDLGREAERLPLRRYVVQGAVINWSNPKTLLFLGAFLPQFVDLSRPAFGQIMLLGLIVMAVATTTDCVYAVLAGRMRHVLTAARVRMLNRVSGVVLMIGGLWLALLKRA